MLVTVGLYKPNVPGFTVDLVNRAVLVRAESAKTRKARTVYFGGRTQKLLAVYLAWHEKNAQASKNDRQKVLPLPRRTV
jgi:hypothetical protein